MLEQEIHWTKIIDSISLRACILLVVCLFFYGTGHSDQGYSRGVETRSDLNFKSYDQKPDFCELRFFGY